MNGAPGCLYVTREHGVGAGGAHLSKITKGEAAALGGGARVSHAPNALIQDIRSFTSGQRRRLEMTIKRRDRLITLTAEVGLAIALVGAITAYALSPMRIGISRNWVAFVGQALILFGNLFIFVRKNAGSAKSWWVIVLALVVHIVGGTALCLYFQDIPILWFAIVGIAELGLVLRVISAVSPA